jgi:hypothetical protein
MVHQFVVEQEKRKDALDFNAKANVALTDLHGLLVAALCVSRFDEDYTDTDEDDKRQALEPLLEYARGVVEDAKEGHEGVWRVTAEFILATESTAPPAAAETV